VDLLTLGLEVGVLVWALVVLGKHGWRSEHPGLIWAMTSGAFVTNVALYWSIVPIMERQAAEQQIGSSLLYGFLIARTFEWTALAHVFTRLALVLGRRYGLPGGFAHLRPGWRLSRSALLGIAVGIVAAGVVSGLAYLWVALGILERPIWVELKNSGATWQAGFVGGIRNLFAEEVVTRLGVQTLLLYHLRRFRWAPWVAVVVSSLFFELWHSGGTDFYFLNFTASLVFAWGFLRGGYESAALGHCVADWLAIALPLLLMA
jgi:hypothetical protein